jgi:uncharacterized protein
MVWGQRTSVAVAFSGGADSTLLLFAAKQALAEKVLAFTIKTPYIPYWECAEAVEFCRCHRIPHRVIETSILREIRFNPENRCYLCKKHLFSILQEEARKAGIQTVIEGSNADDTGVYRPGLAALRELGIESPLLKIGITKGEVRAFSRKLGLPTAEKPPYACLLTRFPYRHEVRIHALERIEKAEVAGPTRVTAHRGSGATAPSPVSNWNGSGWPCVCVSRGFRRGFGLVDLFHQLGYEYVTVDLESYRSGSFDQGPQTIKPVNQREQLRRLLDSVKTGHG